MHTISGDLHAGKSHNRTDRSATPETVMGKHAVSDRTAKNAQPDPNWKRQGKEWPTGPSVPTPHSPNRERNDVFVRA